MVALRSGVIFPFSITIQSCNFIALYSNYYLLIFLIKLQTLGIDYLNRVSTPVRFPIPQNRGPYQRSKTLQHLEKHYFSTAGIKAVNTISTFICSWS